MDEEVREFDSEFYDQECLLDESLYSNLDYIKAVRGSMGFAGWKLRKEFVKLFVEIFMAFRNLFKKEK